MYAAHKLNYQLYIDSKRIFIMIRDRMSDLLAVSIFFLFCYYPKCAEMRKNPIIGHIVSNGFAHVRK